jgi:hypothetical protein
MENSICSEQPSIGRPKEPIPDVQLCSRARLPEFLIMMIADQEQQGRLHVQSRRFPALPTLRFCEISWTRIDRKPEQSD